MNTAFSHIVAIGASAGGLNALETFLGALPDDFATPVVIAIHSSETRALPSLLSGRTSMEVKVATDKTPLACGCVYICPGGADTYFENGMLRVTSDLQARFYKPSVDRLFESLAMEYRERAIAIVMSGMLSDGTKGALRVHEYGATMLVQSPDEAKYESMPSSVIMNDHPQEILPVTALALEVVRLIRDG